ncbi:MAG: mechanosensitive ion channel family protein [Halanaerobiales bacterium]|nr:mechanosensitive ion channel family protein [Halanaerobiales bacterium]
MESEALKYILLNNTIYNYLVSISIIVLGLILIRVLRYVFSKKINNLIKKYSARFADFTDKFIEKRVIPLTSIIIIYAALNRLNLSQSIHKFVNIVFIFSIVIYITLLIQDIIVYTMKKYWEKKQSNQAQDTVFTVSVFLVKLITWLVALLFILDNLNIEIRGLITGLGVGGIAIAFAAQTILADIFSYFTIFLDRPFDIGDFIIIGEYRGNVEHIGIKTTRVRSLSGEQLVFSNNDLTNSRIHNYKRMQRRRINFNFGVVYSTPVEKVEKIPKIIEDIVNSVEKTCFDRAHFATYGDFSLIFQVVYYVEDSDYKIYMNIQEKINLKIKEVFNKENIEFAYPTQSIHVYDNDKNINIEPLNKNGRENHE